MKLNALSFFPFPTHFSNQILYLDGKYGSDGVVAYIKILQHIFGGEGYYCSVDEFNLAVLKTKFGTAGRLLNSVIQDCIALGVFDKTLYESESILTNDDIQYAYIIATHKKNKDKIQSTHCLESAKKYYASYDKNYYETILNETIQNEKKRKEAKEKKETKQKETKRKETKQNETRERKNKTCASVDGSACVSACESVCENAQEKPLFYKSFVAVEPPSHSQDFVFEDLFSIQSSGGNKTTNPTTNNHTTSNSTCDSVSVDNNATCKTMTTESNPTTNTTGFMACNTTYDGVGAENLKTESNATCKTMTTANNSTCDGVGVENLTTESNATCKTMTTESNATASNTTESDPTASNTTDNFACGSASDDNMTTYNTTSESFVCDIQASGSCDFGCQSKADESCESGTSCDFGCGSELSCVSSESGEEIFACQGGTGENASSFSCVDSQDCDFDYKGVSNESEVCSENVLSCGGACFGDTSCLNSASRDLNCSGDLRGGSCVDYESKKNFGKVWHNSLEKSKSGDIMPNESGDNTTKSSLTYSAKRTKNKVIGGGNLPCAEVMAQIQKFEKKTGKYTKDVKSIPENVDLEKLANKVLESDFLMSATNMTLKHCIKHYDKILADVYKNCDLPTGRRKSSDTIITHNYTKEELDALYTDLDTLVFK